MIGPDRTKPQPSDKVENMHTMHPDEKEQGNTKGHHSFEVAFQWTRAGSVEPPPPIEEQEDEYKTFEFEVSQGDDIKVKLDIVVKRW